MTIFVVGDRYTREQVRARIGLSPQKGGDWATGYARIGQEVFVFCNIGVAGRTGHDYPNRWIDDALDWFGKTGSTADQPVIRAMVTGAVTTHVFWRGRDRAPFTYAGVGVADGIWGEKPVEVLWRFNIAAQPIVAAGAVPPTMTTSGTFRHGPPPSFGFKQMLAEDGECFLYLMVLEGAVDALFPALTPAATKRSIVKIGISKDPPRRELELNGGFPKGSAANWAVRNTRTYSSAKNAYNAEGVLLERLAASGRWISGEFAIVAEHDVGGLLA